MKKYLITSPDFYTQNSEIFKEKLHRRFQIHMPQFALYRDKENANYHELACGFIQVCQQKGVKAFLHSNVDLAVALRADGVHLTSTQFEEITRAKKEGLEVVISTHTHDEVLKAQALGADYVTYSPIFQTPNKGEPKGLQDLKELLNKCNIKIFALGGIVEAWHVEMIENSGAYGFASIRYFY